MTPSTKVDYLPSEAVKAILSFMTRQQLIALSGVNRQFHHVSDSPPIETKPLLRIEWLFIEDVGTVSVRIVGDSDMPYEFSVKYNSEKAGVTQLEHMLKQPWLRLKHVGIICENGDGHTWLKLLSECSHCLEGAKYLALRHCGTLPTDVVELVDGLDPLVEIVDVYTTLTD